MAPPKGMPKGAKLRVIGGTCKRGHLLTEDNTYIVRGYVHCADCDKQRQSVNRLINQGVRSHADEHRLSRNLADK